MNMNMFDMVSNVYDDLRLNGAIGNQWLTNLSAKRYGTSYLYDADLMISVRDFGSLEKEYGPDDDEDKDDEYFRRFVKLVMAC